MYFCNFYYGIFVIKKIKPFTKVYNINILVQSQFIPLDKYKDISSINSKF